MQTGHFEEIQTKDLNLADLMHSFAEKVTPNKRGAAQEFRCISRLLKERDLMLTPLPNAKPHIFAALRDKRIKDGVRACQYDLVLLRHAWNMARIGWGWPLRDNPLSLIRMPKNNPLRERRLSTGEYEALRDAACQSRSWYLWPMVNIAIGSAMRRSVLSNLEWKHMDWEKQRAVLPITKNGKSRSVPLSELALKHIEQTPQTADRVFPITDVAFWQTWDRLRDRAGIKDLTFHNLRHESLSLE